MIPLVEPFACNAEHGRNDVNRWHGDRAKFNEDPRMVVEETVYADADG